MKRTTETLEKGYYEDHQFWTDREDLGEREVVRLSETVQRIPSYDSLLDVGAGDGRLARALKTSSVQGHVVVAERSWAAINHVAGDRVLADVVALPFESAAFDVVSACEILEHLPVTSYDAAREEMLRVARRHIVVTVPNDEDLRRGYVKCPSCQCRFHRYRHLRSFSPASLRTLFPGFALREAEPIGPASARLPRHLVQMSRMVGVVPEAGGAPLCPQCGARPRQEERAGVGAPAPYRSGNPGALAARAGSTRAFAERVHRVPFLRRQPWLIAIYQRVM